ncbi:MAG: NAD-binding protein [bacterium]|nr:NAD-binding protein [bacterium]
MHIIIVGGGRIGQHLAVDLSNEKHDVVVIENDKDIADKLAQEINATILYGDGKDMELLEEAGLEKADVLVVTTDSDESNLLISMLAKDVSKARIIVRSSNTEFSSVLEKIGVDRVISPEITTSEQLNALITQPDIWELALLHGKVDLYEFIVTSESPVVGKTSDQVEMPRGALIIVVREEGEFHIPTSDTVFDEGDKVIIITTPELKEKCAKLF